MDRTETITRYGTLTGVSGLERFPGGGLKDCTLSMSNRLETPIGILVPQYEDDGARRKNAPSLSFYESGAIKSISLQQRTSVPTPLGPVPAEVITFYESGRLKRVFPLNGKLSGFWSEENEYQLAPPLSLRLPWEAVSIKPISVYFYESGAVKSVTLWPKEHLTVPTPTGTIETRIGFSLYESGAIRSVEPRKSTPVSTPAGTFHAYDIEAEGICADRNSLVFTEGRVAGLKTSQDSLTVTMPDGTERIYSPGLFMSHFDDELMRIEPLCIFFEADTVIAGSIRLDLSTCRFQVSAFRPDKKTGNGCPGCDGLYA